MRLKFRVLFLNQQAEEVVAEDSESRMDVDNSKSFLLSNLDITIFMNAVIVSGGYFKRVHQRQ